MRDNYYTIPIASPPSTGNFTSSRSSSFQQQQQQQQQQQSSSLLLKNSKKCHKCMTFAALSLSVLGFCMNLLHLNVLTLSDTGGADVAQHWAHLPPSISSSSSFYNNKNVMSKKEVKEEVASLMIQTKRKKKNSQKNERIIFQSILSRVIQALESCTTLHSQQQQQQQQRRRLKVLSLSSTTSTANKHSSFAAAAAPTQQQQQQYNGGTTTISPFGIINALTNVLHKPPPQSPQSQQDDNDDDDDGLCYLPSSTACHAQSYTVIFSFSSYINTATSTTNNNNNNNNKRLLRSMFLQLLKLITYTSITEIIVFIPPSLTNLIRDREDVEYGTRLKWWDEDANHKVRLIYISDLLLGKKEEEDYKMEKESLLIMWEKYNLNTLSPKNEALLYIQHHHDNDNDDVDVDDSDNQDINNENNKLGAKQNSKQATKTKTTKAKKKAVSWNEQTFLVGFELWKRSSQSFVSMEKQDFYDWNVLLEEEEQQGQVNERRTRRRRLHLKRDEERKKIIRNKKEVGAKKEKQKNDVQKEKETKRRSIEKHEKAVVSRNKKEKNETKMKTQESKEETKKQSKSKQERHDKELELQKAKKQQQQQQQGQYTKNNQDAVASSSTFTPKCQNGPIVSYSHLFLQQQQQQIMMEEQFFTPSNYFYFLHRDYLCFLSHSIFSELRRHISSIANNNNGNHDYYYFYYTDVMAISTMISQLSGSSILTFPLVPPVSSSSSPQSASLYTTKIDKKNNVPIIQQNKGADSTMIKHQSEVLNTMFDYFGTIPPKPKQWCDESIFSSSTAENNVDEAVRKRGNNCDYSLNNGLVVDVNKIPWMKRGGIGYDICR